MGLTDFIRSQFIDIIEWTDDSRDTLSFRFPDEDKEIKNGAQLIVRESQAVQFVYLGQYGDLFGPGKHTLTTDNIPILLAAQGLEVRLRVAVQGRRLLRHDAAVHRQQVGHVEPGHDARPGLRHRPRPRVRHLRLPHRRSAEVPEGSRRHRQSLPARRVRRRHAVAHRQRVQRGAGDRARCRCSTSRRATASSARRCCRSSIRCSRRSTASRWRASSSRTSRCRRRSKQAIDKRSSMAAVGNLNDYVKFQMAQGLEKGGAGVGGVGAEMAVGMCDGAADDESAGRHHGAGDARAAGAPAAPRRPASRRRSARPMRRRCSASPRPT